MWVGWGLEMGGKDSESCQLSVCFCWLSWDRVSGDPRYLCTEAQLQFKEASRPRLNGEVNRMPGTSIVL